MSSVPALDAALAALLRHLEERQAAGDTHVWLSPRARKEIRELPSLRTVSANRIPPPTAAPVPAEAPPEPGPSAVPLPAPPPATVAATGSEARLVPEGTSKADKLLWLAEVIRTDPSIRALDSLREVMVFSTGSPEARLMFVGEAPGAEEERQGQPFVGPAGQLLTKMILAMGLKREDTYISNIVKYRPALPNQGESNRKPTAEEMAACLPVVRAEVEVVRPEVIVALGGTAAQGLLGIEDPVTRMRNRFHSFEGTPVMVTFHPSYLLRNTALSERRKVWEDLLLVMERLQLPISAKQRAFFTS